MLKSFTNDKKMVAEATEEEFLALALFKFN